LISDSISFVVLLSCLISTHEFYFLSIFLPILLQVEEWANGCMVLVASCWVKPRQ